MASVKFTNATLEQFISEASGKDNRQLIWDSEARGLGAYVTSSGKCTLFAHYRLANGYQRKAVLGRFKEISIDQARKLAREYNVAAKQDIDIVAERKRAALPKHTLTIAQAFKEFMEAQHRRKNSANTIRLNNQNWKNHLSRYQGRYMATVTKHEVRAWHKEWGKRGPTVANQTARLFRAMYNYALKFHDDLPPNPTTAVEFFTEVKERRLIATDDLAAWREKVEAMPNPIRRCYWRFIALTGLRRMDAASVRWDEVFETHIHRPNPKGGAAKAFNVPMTTPLRALLDEAKVAQQVLYPDSPFVFPAESVTGYVITAQEQKYLPGCAPHDLRRTYATACVEVGIAPYIIKRLLNHATDSADVTARYIHISDSIKRDAAERVAAYLVERMGRL